MADEITPLTEPIAEPTEGTPMNATETKPAPSRPSRRRTGQAASEEASTEKKDKKPPIGLKYQGDGTQFFAGVPRRDLTVHETVDLLPKQVVNITAGGLYELTEAGKKALADKEKAHAAD